MVQAFNDMVGSQNTVLNVYVFGVLAPMMIVIVAGVLYAIAKPEPEAQPVKSNETEV